MDVIEAPVFILHRLELNKSLGWGRPWSESEADAKKDLDVK